MFIAINRINVPKGQSESLEKRFASSEGLKGQAGVLGFELLRRTWQPAQGEQAAAAETEEYMAVTRWETEEQFHAWTKSDAFKKAHSHGNKEKAAACASKSAEGQQQAEGAKAHGCGGGKMSASASGYAVVVTKEPQLV